MAELYYARAKGLPAPFGPKEGLPDPYHGLGEILAVQGEWNEVSKFYWGQGNIEGGDLGAWTAMERVCEPDDIKAGNKKPSVKSTALLLHGSPALSFGFVDR